MDKNNTQTANQELTKKDFVSDQDVRWCPGCGDYAILSQVQKIFPSLGIPKEQFLVVSGIGCSSRFPYYMDTFGFHSIHGRAPAFAAGAKLSNPDLSVWIATGDGDAMSIGGNHFIHLLRRNIDVNVLLFNNRIYGLTKGQYSPTSELGKVTKSTPMGSLDFPFNPPSLALGAQSTFVARTIDREQKHLGEVLKRAHAHKGCSFVEIYQNCNIFNDGAFSELTDRETKLEMKLTLEHSKPMLFGAENNRGIVLEGSKLKSVELNGEYSVDDILVHDENDKNLGMLLSEATYDPELPTPVGIIYQEDKQTYDELMEQQIADSKSKNPNPSIDELLHSGNTWEVK